LTSATRHRQHLEPDGPHRAQGRDESRNRAPPIESLTGDVVIAGGLTVLLLRGIAIRAGVDAIVKDSCAPQNRLRMLWTTTSRAK
jgi:hypothetical protein